MSPHETHHIHPHTHGPGCGHPIVSHEGHQDYAHDGHLHHAHDGHVDEHAIQVSQANPDVCTPAHACSRHAVDHEHGVGCGHQALPHGEHVDFVVDGHLHHPCSGHCDDHGPGDCPAVALVARTSLSCPWKLEVTARPACFMHRRKTMSHLWLAACEAAKARLFRAPERRRVLARRRSVMHAATHSRRVLRARTTKRSTSRIRRRRHSIGPSAARFGKWILVAPPYFLGLLRKESSRANSRSTSWRPPTRISTISTSTLWPSDCET